MKKRLADLVLRIGGWQPEGSRPVSRRSVVIAAPHTSNWDLLWMLAFAVHFDVRIRWMGKHTLFRGPMGTVLRALGGIPIRRHKSENVVQAMARSFEEYSDLALAIPPEATRSYTPYWKSGFYHIALAAQVPIVMSYLDYGRKRGGFGPELVPTGEIARDMEEIRAFYGDKTGKYPDCFGEIRLKEEC